MACKLLHSSKQAAFVFFYRVLEGGGRGAVLTPGTLEWTLVQEVKLGEEKSMTWTLPGALCQIRSLGITNHSQEFVDQTPPSCFLPMKTHCSSAHTGSSISCNLGPVLVFNVVYVLAHQMLVVPVDSK